MMSGIDGYDLCNLIKGKRRKVMEGLRVLQMTTLPSLLILMNCNFEFGIYWTRQEKIRLHHKRQLTSPHETINPKTEENEFLQQLYTVIEENINDNSLSVEKNLPAKWLVSIEPSTGD